MCYLYAAETFRHASFDTGYYVTAFQACMSPRRAYVRYLRGQISSERSSCARI